MTVALDSVPQLLLSFPLYLLDDDQSFPRNVVKTLHCPLLPSLVYTSILTRLSLKVHLRVRSLDFLQAWVLLVAYLAWKNAAFKGICTIGKWVTAYILYRHINIYLCFENGSVRCRLLKYFAVQECVQQIDPEWTEQTGEVVKETLIWTCFRCV